MLPPKSLTLRVNFSLGAVTIGAENFAWLADQATGTPWVPRNPRPITGPAQVREILLIGGLNSARTRGCAGLSDRRCA